MRYYVLREGDDQSSGTSWQTAFATLTRAAGASGHGDEVWVAAGTYQEGGKITIPEGVKFYGGFAGGETDLSQRDIEKNRAIVDGENSYRCIANFGFIDGLDITQGKSTEFGGGIYNKGTVQSCSVYDNTSYDYGGGIYNSGTVSNCTIHQNRSKETYSPKGGGIYNSGGRVTGCFIYYNYATSPQSVGCGGGIYNDKGDLVNCLIFENVATTRGGGVFNVQGTVTNCTLYGNEVSFNGTGGGISNSGAVINCISLKNICGDIIGGTIQYCCYGGSSQEESNFTSDPRFVNNSGDYHTWDFHLKNGSPCIDAGNLEGCPAMDLEGNPRPGGDGKICLGAYESPDHFMPGPTTPTKRLYVKPGGNDTLDGLSWESAFQTIDCARRSSFRDDSMCEIWIASGEYLEGKTLSFQSWNILYGGFAGNETDLSQRNIELYKTIINGDNSFRCIDNYGVVDGLSVTGGKNDRFGSGIYNYGLVTNCTIYGNTSSQGGGGVYNHATISSSTIHGNTSQNGGGIYTCSLVKNCRIHDNTALEKGGGVYGYGGIVRNCTICHNKAECGGGCYINNECFLNQCAIYQNTASDEGGGVYNDSSQMENCSIHQNHTTQYGGGIRNLQGKVISCNIYQNTSSNLGGGIHNTGMWDSNGMVVNCTVYGNSASYYCGGIYNPHPHYGQVINCISWKNEDVDIFGETIRFCCFGEATGTDDNFSTPPLFMNTSGDISTWDFHLRDSSPCIDAGDPEPCYNDGCRPPAKGAVRNDVGSYGGPCNCGWLSVTRRDIVDYLLGKNVLSDIQKTESDQNGDGVLNVCDLLFFF